MTPGNRGVPAKYVVVALFVVLSVAFGGGDGFAAGRGMQVSADEYGLWDGSRLFIAQGNVTVRYDGALITADTLQYDAEAGYAVFIGHVFYADADQELAGRTLHFDLNEGVAIFDDMEAVLHSDGVKGPMFISGGRVRAADGDVFMERAVFTTCECEGDPAYRFVAKELEIYPQDRIVVRGATFYDHKVPLLYLPYLTLSLKERSSRFDMPQIGYSERTGWYVKLTYNYVLKSGLYGALLFDYFQRLGVGAGVRHTYVDDETGVGTLYAYAVGDGFGGADGSFAWRRRWEGAPWDVDAGYDYDVSAGPGGAERERLLGRVAVGRRTDDGDFSVAVDYRLENRSTWMQPETKLSAETSWRQRFGSDWQVRLQAETFDERRGADRRRWLGYMGEVQRVGPRYTLRVGLEQQVNPDWKDPEGSGSPAWTHVSRMPDIALRLPRTGGLNLAFGAVRLKEEPSGTAAWRGEVEAGLPTRTWRLAPSLTANVNATTRLRAYTTGETQWTLQGRAGFNAQLARPLSFTLQYNYRDVWGDTPFRFDRVGAAESVSPRFNWRSAAWTASLSASYNVRTQRWGKASFQATWRATPRLVLRGSGTIDVYEGRPDRIAATLDWRPSEASSLRLGAVYDFRRDEWRTKQADARFAVGGGWELGVTAIYDYARDAFTRNHAYVSHNACGCREIRLRYDQVQEEIWLEYHITAFPSSRVALGAGDDALMFEADALTDFLAD